MTKIEYEDFRITIEAYDRRGIEQRSRGLLRVLAGCATTALEEALNLQSNSIAVSIVRDRESNSTLADEASKVLRAAKVLVAGKAYHRFTVAILGLTILALSFLGFNLSSRVEDIAADSRRIASESANQLAQQNRESLQACLQQSEQATRTHMELIKVLQNKRCAGPPTDSNTGGAGIGTPIDIGGYKIFGPGDGVEIFDLVRAITESAGPDKFETIFKAVGEGAEAARKVTGAARETVGLVSDFMEFYRKYFPDTQPEPGQVPRANSNPPVPPVEGQPLSATPPKGSDQPRGTIFDQAVAFEFGSARLTENTLAELNVITQHILNSRQPVLIEGHADGVGAWQFNIDLSKRRAEIVRNYLLSKGVPRELLYFHGYGQGYFWRPFVPYDGANRRVRIIQCVVGGNDRCVGAATSIQ